MTIDLNCDMGESFGNYRLGEDEALMQYVSSINVACGFHAGDADVMKKAVDLAAKHNIAVGAHPAYPDLQGFGRREMKLSADEVYNIVLYQVGALWAFTKSVGIKLAHVKPHGALYNTAAKQPTIAAAIVRAVKDVGNNLKLVGLSGSCLISEGKKFEIETVSEVFADRVYTDDGQLMARDKPNALIEDPDRAGAQVLKMIKQGVVISASGKEVNVEAQTVCIHGDGKNALAFAKAIHGLLTANNVSIQHP